MAAHAPIQLDDRGYIVRLNALAPLSREEVARLEACARSSSQFPARREVSRGAATTGHPIILLSGWGLQVRDFRDGRRQILHVLVPGDIMDLHGYGEASPPTAMIAATSVSVAALPDLVNADSGLARAYAANVAIERECLLRQIARLGRLDAYERVADFMLELGERLAVAGLGRLESFPFPLTQEMLADVLGLTSVHVNRTLQNMRRDGLLEIRGSMARLPDLSKLHSLVDWQSPTPGPSFR